MVSSKCFYSAETRILTYKLVVIYNKMRVITNIINKLFGIEHDF